MTAGIWRSSPQTQPPSSRASVSGAPTAEPAPLRAGTTSWQPGRSGIDPPSFAACWLAGDLTLMVAPLDPATRAPTQPDAGPPDPVSTGRPAVILAIGDTLLARRTHQPTAVTPNQVTGITGTHLGYLVCDRAGTDSARYDAAAAAAPESDGDVSVRSWVRADRPDLDQPLAEAVAHWITAEWPWQQLERSGR